MKKHDSISQPCVWQFRVAREIRVRLNIYLMQNVVHDNAYEYEFLERKIQRHEIIFYPKLT